MSDTESQPEAAPEADATEQRDAAPVEKATQEARDASDGELKNKYRRIDERNAKLAKQVKELTEKLDGFDSIMAELEQVKASLSEKDGKVAELQTGAKRREFADAVLAGVAQPLQEEASLMLKGLMADGFDIDHSTPDDQLKEMVERANETLRQKAPRLFSDAPRMSEVDRGRPDFSRYSTYGEVPADLRKHLSPLETARLSGQPTRKNLLLPEG